MMSYRERNKGTGGRRGLNMSGYQEILEVLARVECKVNKLLRRSNIELDMEFEQMIDTKNLVREVTETKGAVDSMKVAWQAMIDRLNEIETNDPAAQAEIDKAVQELQAIQDQIAAAVAANSGGSTGSTGATGPGPGGSIGGAEPTE